MPLPSGATKRRLYFDLFKAYYRVLRATAETKTERKRALKKAHRLAGREHARHMQALKKFDKEWQGYKKLRDSAQTDREKQRAEKLKIKIVNKIKKEHKRHAKVRVTIGVPVEQAGVDETGFFEHDT